MYQDSSVNASLNIKLKKKHAKDTHEKTSVNFDEDSVLFIYMLRLS